MLFVQRPGWPPLRQVERDRLVPGVLSTLTPEVFAPGVLSTLGDVHHPRGVRPRRPRGVKGRLFTASSSQRPPHLAEDLFFVREAHPGFLRDDLCAHTHLKDAAVALDQRGFDAELLPQQVRHPGGAREVASARAVEDGYVGRHEHSRAEG